MKLLQLNDLAKLHNGSTVLFCKTDYLFEYFRFLQEHPHKAVLITGNSDYSITDEMVSKVPSCIVKWFAENADTTDPRVEGLPIGIENSEECILEGHGPGYEHAKQTIELRSKNYDVTPTKSIYANFSVDTHPSRVTVRSLCEEIPHITTEISQHHSEINNKSYSNYVESILDHKMVVVPRGNGVDCHRLWEVLALKRVAIIKRENALRYFYDLPIIILDRWEDLKNKELLDEKYDQVKSNSLKKVYAPYWIERIKNENFTNRS
jgi:hypothetical protein